MIKKSKTLIFVVLGIVSLLVLGITLVATADDTASQNTQNTADIASRYNNAPISDDQDAVKLKNERNMLLENPSEKPTITREDAISVANGEVGTIKTEAKKVNATYHLMTYENFRLFKKEALDANPDLKTKGYIDKLPVWIVSYKGVQLPAKGGRFGAVVKPLNSTEFNMVVDAKTGQPLFGFQYR